MKHVKDEYSRTLKYYYIKRNKEQQERWQRIIDTIYQAIDMGKMRDEIVDELMQGGYRIMNEDVRATKLKLKGDYNND